jgi:hypothetical protein
LEFILARGAQLSAFEVTLQIGAGAWLRENDAVASLVDERQTMSLRGLLAVPCRLVVSQRREASTVPSALRSPPPSMTFEFVPSVASPTLVRVDLTSLDSAR